MKVSSLFRWLAVFMVSSVISGCAVASVSGNKPTPMVSIETPISDIPAPTETEAAPTEEPSPSGAPTDLQSGWMVYVGQDGNIWLLDPATQEQRQVTTDGAGYPTTGTPAPVVVYQAPKWSSDGKLLAYERQDGEVISEGYSFQFSLWVYDITKGEATPVLEGEQTTGHDWKPGTHQLAYGQSFANGYFSKHGTDAELAKGIRLFDMDTGETSDLVQPERGFQLVHPKWSPDGNFLSFEEVYLMEGRGKFAIYDFAAKEYIAWDKPIGGTSWGKDSQTIAFDTLVYIPSGTEAIFIGPITGGEETQISPAYSNGYAYSPVYSPDGSRLAYLAGLDGPDSIMISVFILEADGETVSEMGKYENAGNLSWTPDGSYLLLSSGPYDKPEILMVSTADGSHTVLAQGNYPAWSPVSQMP